MSLSGPQFETGTKERFLAYTSHIRPLYQSYRCAGPFPNLMSHPAFGESMQLWSCLPLCVQFSVSASRILCSLTSGNTTLWSLPHTCDQSIVALNEAARNNEQPSCNHFCSAEAVSIVQPEYVFVALGTQHVMRMRCNVICGLPRSTIFFHTIS